jgi:hypothetical protein
MPISDYAHHNEEAARIWWEEEGKHPDEPRCDEDDFDRERDYDAADAFAEELADKSTEELRDMLSDEEYLARWPKTRPLILAELEDRS